LLDAMRGERELKLLAIGALGSLGDTNAIPALLPLLEDSEQSIRQRTATALGVIGCETAIGELTRLAREDSAEEVRAQACGALGDIGQVSVQAVIIETAAQLHKHREAAAWALGHVGDSNAIPLLTEMLSDTDSQTRFAAAYALAEIGGSAAADALASHLKDEDEYARHAKACALAMLGRTNSLPSVRESLRSGQDWRRFGAALALIRLGNAVTADEWVPMQSDPAPALREFAVACASDRAMPALTAMLSHRGRDWRHYTARGMVFFNEPSMLPALREACRDSDSQVRHAARVAVRCIERRTAER
jgi:HEAT repeat protein